MRVRTTAGGLAGLLLGWLTGCSAPGAFQCSSDDQCLLDGQQGICTPSAYCAFEDEACASGWAYGELAGGTLAGTCVPLDDGTGTSDGTTSTSSTSSSTTSTTSTTGPADSSGPPSPCSPGDPCTPSDPCALAGICDPEGNCEATDFVLCELPGDCWAITGECTPEGECVFIPQSREFPCEDGDPCTVGDTCDGGGSCLPGPACSDTPCQIGTCTEEGCQYENLPDGDPCGMTPAERCCGGSCVDISSNDDHCGGCFLECDGGEDCESLDQTPMCDIDEPGISGRCSCRDPQGCPSGQSCLFDGPYPGLCEPASDDECHGTVEHLKSCPDFCSY